MTKYKINIVYDGAVVDEFIVHSDPRDAIEAGLEEEGFIECDDCGDYVHVDDCIEKDAQCFCPECGK